MNRSASASALGAAEADEDVASVIAAMHAIGMNLESGLIEEFLKPNVRRKGPAEGRSL